MEPMPAEVIQALNNWNDWPSEEFPVRDLDDDIYEEEHRNMSTIPTQFQRLELVDDRPAAPHPLRVVGACPECGGQVVWTDYYHREQRRMEWVHECWRSMGGDARCHYRVLGEKPDRRAFMAVVFGL